jgi:hypothetical protein
MVSLVISAGGAGLGAGFIFSSHSLILFLHACSRLLSHFMAALKLLIASLDSAYHVFKEKANIMKDLDQAVAAQAFEDRAKKIEPYINIDNNENE